jgi:hypothetical protein
MFPSVMHEGSCFLPHLPTLAPMFIAALFTTAKLWKQPRCPTTDEWIKKMWYLYTMEFYSTIRKNEIMSLEGKRHVK